VIRRQLPVFRLCAIVVTGGLVAVGITWRNLIHERLTLDVGLQRSRIEALRKEVQHFDGQIEVQLSYSRLAKWALETNGWRALPDHTTSVRISEKEMTPAARDEAKVLGIYKNE